MGRYASDVHNYVQQFDDCDRTAAAIGGGYYSRAVPMTPGARLYRVRKLCAEGEFATVTQALAQWQADKRAGTAGSLSVIEIADSATYHEAPVIVLDAFEALHLRAADMCRPVLRMFDYQSGEHERIVVRGAAGSHLTLDGIMVAGGPLALLGGAWGARFRVLMRHCTLVPGWDTEGMRETPWRAHPSIEVDASCVALCIDHCVVGALQLHGKGGALHVSDSIVDGGHAAGLAIADQAHGAANVCASIIRSTVIGVTQVEALTLAENAVFLGALLACRRDMGAVRHCYLAPGSMTPQREHCQPDLTHHAGPVWRERQRLQPRYRSLRYGGEGYGKLTPDSAWEIIGGADDDAQMGAYHDLYRSPLVLDGETTATLPDNAGAMSARGGLDRSERVDQVLA